MQDVTLVGIDLGKHSFHLHGQGRTGKAVLRMKLTRKQLVEFLVTFPTCAVVTEACAGAHHMARKLATFGLTSSSSRRSSFDISSRATRTFLWMLKRFAKRHRVRRCGS
jgi:hypothetical protein